jgi:DNA-directed RNA polymerase specialized sigma24 family protein
MAEPSRFEELMGQVRQGSQSAVRELVDTYGDHIIRIIRQNLDRRLRAQFDSLDFEQDVWASFFAMPTDRLAFRTPAELGAYLTSMAENKVAETFRGQAGTIKRSLLRQRSLDALGDGVAAVADRPSEATPSQFALADERWEQLNRGRSPQIRVILDLLRDGHSYDEIGRRTGLHPKAIQRRVQQLKKGAGL